MTECTNPEDVFAVLLALWPGLGLPGWIALAVGALLLLVEFGMHFRYGGIPDGFLGALGLVGVGIAGIIWTASWPATCGGTISLSAWILVGVGVLIGSLVLWFWSARKRDGGMLVRGYDYGAQPGGGAGPASGTDAPGSDLGGYGPGGDVR